MTKSPIRSTPRALWTATETASAIWLSPIYASPLADEGYDISDYYAIDPRFGTMEDLEELLAEATKRDMTILMDLVVNHCSDEHEWFRKACEDPDGRYGKFFYLRDKDPSGKLPTNWRSYFGGPCWDELPGTGKLYMHVFHKKQPDLNWENPDLREEVYRNIRWWMEKGIGGFRIDAIINIKKPAVLRDYPADRDDGLASVENMLIEAEGIGEFLGEMRDKAFAPYDAFTVGEVFNEKEEDLPLFIGDGGYFSTMFDFSSELYGRSDKDHVNTFVVPTTGKEMEFKSKLVVRAELPDGETFTAWQCMNFMRRGTMYKTDNGRWKLLANGFTCVVYLQSDDDPDSYRTVYQGVLCDTPDIGRSKERDERWKTVPSGGRAYIPREKKVSQPR